MHSLHSFLAGGLHRATIGRRSEDTPGGGIAKSETGRGSRPVRLIVIGGLLLIAAIISATGFLLFDLRDRALDDAGRELRNLALVLAEQTSRTFQAVDLVESNFIDKLHLAQADSAEQFIALGSGEEAHTTLRNMTSSLPQLDAVALIDA